MKTKFQIGVFFALLFCLGQPALALSAADSPSNSQVESQIDEIIQAPEYDWLKGQKPSVKKGSAKKNSSPRPTSRSPRKKQSDCGYEPTPGDKTDKGTAQEGSCNYKPNGNNTEDDFKDVNSEGNVTGGGCTGCRPSSTPKCDCGPTLNRLNCACAPTIGNCGGLSSGMAAPFGIIMGIVVIFLIIFFVTKAIIERDRPSDNSQLIQPAPLDAPDKIRLSQISAFKEETLMDKAYRAAAEQNYKAAVGWCYLAGLSNLNRFGYITLTRFITNRIILTHIKKNQGPADNAAHLIRHFEELFFGSRPPSEQRWLECKTIVEESLAKAPSIKS